MCTFIFYTLVFVALIFQVLLLFSGNKIRGQIKLKGNSSPIGIIFNSLGALTILVVFGGVFTSQSPLFILFVFAALFGKFLGWRVITKRILFVLILAFVLLNKCQLHINFYQQLLNLFAQC
nr:MAG TPA: hypothetical protein [Caudoviricetes sp.]